MKLQTKFSLAITGVLVATVILVGFFTTRAATESILQQMQRDGEAIGQVLARSSSFVTRVPKQVERAVGEQMVVEARIAAQLVAIAEGRAGMSPKEIKAVLKDITDNTVLEEFWVTDETARAYLTNTDVDFTFSPDPRQQPQASVFYRLLQERNGVVIQDARKREIDDKLFKYAGVSGVDKARIVQVGYEATILDDLSRDINTQKLVDELTGQANVAAIRVVDREKRDIAASSRPLAGAGAALTAEDTRLLDEALTTGGVRSAEHASILRVATPVMDGNKQVQVVALVYLTTDAVQSIIRDSILRSTLVSLAVVAIGVLVSFALSKGITHSIRNLTAAAVAMESGALDLEEINRLGATKGRDEVAALSRVFARMAAEVKARETRLKQQVEELRIEIDHARKAKQVAEITETDYFRNLRQKAKEMRGQ